jgi:hypothetical protein
MRGLFIARRKVDRLEALSLEYHRGDRSHYDHNQQEEDDAPP